jgi:hypothetical protein
MGTRLIRVLLALAAPGSSPNGPERIFPLDAAFRFKLLCGNPRLPHSSRLGETCPTTTDAVGSVALRLMYRDAGSKPPTQASRPEGRLAALGNASMEFVVSQVS